MKDNNTPLPITFSQAGALSEVPLALLINAVTDFLDQLSTRTLVGGIFCDLIGDGDGKQKFSKLLAVCGYPDEPREFFLELLKLLGKSDSAGSIKINNVTLPQLLLMALLEVVLPGNRFISIKTVEQLEQSAGISVDSENRLAMQQVVDTYPVRLSMHTIRQMHLSPAVAYQYLPFIEELDPVGHTNTWIGQFHQGLLEQMYQNRVIFLLNMSCPVYCRFCFRKHKESRNEANPSQEDIERAVEHVRQSPSIKEVVMTGGDPFMSRANISQAIDALKDVEHVQALRLATRSIAYYPHLFLADNGDLLTYLKQKNLELQAHNKRLEVATHFIHPDEISPQSLRLITELVGNGIAVYVQTPFLNGCNDQGPELARLFSLLRGAGAELHYIYIPCSPIHGNSVYWAPISKGLEAGTYLRAHLSDRVIPRICTATPIGKMDWHTSGWAVEPVPDNEHFIWIRSPYTPEYFKEFAPLANELENIRVNEEGTIDIQYMADLGDDSLFLGSRSLEPGRNLNEQATTEAILPWLQEDERLAPSLGKTGSAKIARVHETRVEIELGCGQSDFAYIKRDERITDIVVIVSGELLTCLIQIKEMVRWLDECPNVNSIRLRSPTFSYHPDHYSPAAVDILAGLNKLTVAQPLRLEIETRFLVADEITKVHDALTRQLNNHGITVYNNTPLLGRINDNPAAITDLAYRCRKAGIEFHHVYVAGTALQQKWNEGNPVALSDVVDIATRVRREGSGREVPRYIISTPLGEVDFGLSSRFIVSDGNLLVKLLPYDLSYYQAIDADFHWPAGIREDGDGKPLVPITGLLKTTDFALC